MFDRIFASFAGEGPQHSGEPSLKGDVPRHIGRTRGGLNSKLHAVCDEKWRPLVSAPERRPDERPQEALLIMLDVLPPAANLIADKGYDNNWFRQALIEKSIEPCIPSNRTRKQPLPYDKRLYRQRHRIENMLCILNNWGRIAAAVTFYLNQ
ncbi:transposase [Pseudochelatococcus contaminans]|uniref:Transposase n=1 Tax=Pseudochelatococcus contaminans TaxID=1538103 RepID=A0A7W6EHT3_9HYPH|nr:transposase [Pseudochelatococcus contaminans]MBB3810426.1 transposase [Pseudochelatococcus contaminans]